MGRGRPRLERRPRVKTRSATDTRPCKARSAAQFAVARYPTTTRRASRTATTCRPAAEKEGLAMSVTERYLQNNELYASHFAGPQSMEPSAHAAVVACMDARMNVYGILGLQEGEASVIRNAGGVVTDDEIRSLAISQRLLGTREIVLIHHTDCGMLTFTDDAFKRSIQDETG